MQEPVAEVTTRVQQAWGSSSSSSSSPPARVIENNKSPESSWDDEDTSTNSSSPVKRSVTPPQVGAGNNNISNREQAFPALSRVSDNEEVNNIRPKKFDDEEDYLPSASSSKAKDAESLRQQNEAVASTMSSNDFAEGTTPDLPVITSFDDMGFSHPLLRGIYGFGFEKPSPIQTRGIPAFMSGRDLIAQAHSGTGKTGLFATGTINLIEKIRDVKNPFLGAIIISPTRMLAEQSHGVIKDIGARITPPLKVECFMGGRSVADDIRAAVGCEIATGTTGRIIDLYKRGKLSLKYVKLLVLDEADELLKETTDDRYNNGQEDNSFEAHIKIITDAMAKDSQIVIISATLTEATLRICNEMLRDPIKILLKPETLSLKGIRQHKMILELKRPYNSRNEDMADQIFQVKYYAFNEIFKSTAIGQTIVFCRDISSCEQLFETMIQNQYQVAIAHRLQTYDERKKNIEDFKKASARILVATDMVSRGFDAHNVSLVINFDMPSGSMYKETYLHRIGRSGRHGRKGNAINICIKGNTSTGGGQNRNREQSDISKCYEIEKYFGCVMEELSDNLEGCL